MIWPDLTTLNWPAGLLALAAAYLLLRLHVALWRVLAVAAAASALPALVTWLLP